MSNERQKPTTREYRDNYDRIFGVSKTQRKRLRVQKGPITSDVCDDPGCTVGGCGTRPGGGETNLTTCENCGGDYGILDGIQVPCGCLPRILNCL